MGLGRRPREWEPEEGPEPVWFKKALYLGGLPGLPDIVKGDMWFGPDMIGLGTPYPEGPLLPMSDVASVEVNGAEVARSKVGAVLTFGVLGFAAKGAKDQTSITVALADGRAAYFQLDKWSPFEVRANIAPVLHAARIPFSDENVPRRATVSRAEELLKLAELHDRGVLSDDEFAAEKARLLSSS